MGFFIWKIVFLSISEISVRFEIHGGSEKGGKNEKNEHAIKLM